MIMHCRVNILDNGSSLFTNVLIAQESLAGIISSVHMCSTNPELWFKNRAFVSTALAERNAVVTHQ